MIIGFMPIFGRPEITGFSLQAAKRIIGLDDLIVVGSTEEDKATAIRAGVDYYEHQNLPLGLKWQYGFELALEQGADKILFLGSDDWWEPGLLDNLETLGDYPLVAPLSWGVIDLNHRVAHLQRYAARHDGAGTGRLYDANFIREKLGGVLYEADAPFRGMDFYAMERIEKAGGQVVTSPGAVVFQLKAAETKEQVWRIDELITSPNIVSRPLKGDDYWSNQILREWDEWVRTTSR